MRLQSIFSVFLEDNVVLVITVLLLLYNPLLIACKLVFISRLSRSH